MNPLKFPMTLTQFARSAPEERRDESGRLRDGGQTRLLRDRLLYAICESSAEADAMRPGNDGDEGVIAPCMVIASHLSSGCVLPVVRIEPIGMNWRATVRGNFHDWKVSIHTFGGAKVEIDHGSLFNPKETHESIYCEGIPADSVFGSYAKDRSRFTVSLANEHTLFTFFYLLSRWSRKVMAK